MYLVHRKIQELLVVRDRKLIYVSYENKGGRMFPCGHNGGEVMSLFQKVKCQVVNKAAGQLSEKKYLNNLACVLVIIIQPSAFWLPDYLEETRL